MIPTKTNAKRVSDQALEMVMRDVLDGMLELSLDFAFCTDCTSFEIIEILPEKNSIDVESEAHVNRQISSDCRGDVLPFPTLRKTAG